MNVHPYEMRKQLGLPMDLVAVHPGYENGANKTRKLEELGFWKPELWDAAGRGRTLRRVRANVAAATRGGSRKADGLGPASIEAVGMSGVIALPAAVLMLAASLVLVRRRRAKRAHRLT